MDDLTKLKGVGDVTARRLADAGVTTFAGLAVATDEVLSAVKAAAPDEWASWREQAAKLAPNQPIDLNTASAEQIAAQAAKIETARLQLAQHANNAVLSFGNLKAAQGASESDFQAAETAFNTAINAVHAAVAEARGLLGVPEDAPLPLALLEELAPLESLPPFVPSIVRSAEASAPAAQVGGTETENAGDTDTVDQLSQAANAQLFSEQDEAHAFLADIIAKARAAAAAGELAEAGEFLRENRRELLAGQVLLAELLAGINAEIDSLDLIHATAPVEHAVEVTATVDSRWRIGRQFTKTATVFEAGELAADELLALKADPKLVVAEVH